MIPLTVMRSAARPGAGRCQLAYHMFIHKGERGGWTAAICSCEELETGRHNQPRREFMLLNKTLRRRQGRRAWGGPRSPRWQCWRRRGNCHGPSRAGCRRNVGSEICRQPQPLAGPLPAAFDSKRRIHLNWLVHVLVLPQTSATPATKTSAASGNYPRLPER